MRQVTSHVVPWCPIIVLYKVSCPAVAPAQSDHKDRRTSDISIMVNTGSVLLFASLTLALVNSNPLTLPPLPQLPQLPQLPFLPQLLQTVVTGGGTTGVTGGVTGGVTTTTTVPVTTTMPVMMAMAPMLPAVALGIVKALFICELSLYHLFLSSFDHSVQPRLSRP